MFVLGIDPGCNGALVLIDDASLQVIDWLDMPLVRAGKLAWVDGAILGDWLEAHTPQVAVIELVHSWAGDKRPSNTALLARLAGGVETMCSAMSIPIAHATATSWKRRAGLLRAAKSASWLLAKARLSWPAGGLTLAKHHGRAEASLIALHGRAQIVPLKAPKRSKAVAQRAAENVPPGLLFGIET